MKQRLGSRLSIGRSALIVSGLAVITIVGIRCCNNSRPVVDLKWIEVLPGVCGPLPSDFRLYGRYNYVIRDVVVYEHWGVRYPEKVVVRLLDDASNAESITRIFLENHCDCKWKKRIQRPEEDAQSIRFRDHRADSSAEMTYCLKQINGNAYFIAAYSISCRNYVSVFERTLPQFQSCENLDHYIPISTNINRE